MRFLILFIFFTTTSYSQEDLSIENNISFQKANDVLLLEHIDEKDIENVYSLAVRYYEISLDTAFLLAEKIVDCSKKSNDKNQCCQAMIMLAEINKMQGETEESLTILEEVKELAKSTDNIHVKASINALYGSIAKDKGENEEAISYFLEAVKIYESLGKTEAIADMYGNISGIFFNSNQLEKSQEYNMKLGKLANELDNDVLRVNAGGSEAIYLMTKGIHYYLNNQLDTANMQQTIDTLNAYFEKSEIKYDEILVLARKTNNAGELLTLLNNMVALANNMEKPERAEKFAIEAMVLAEKVESKALLVQTKTNLASVFMRQGKYEKALKYAKEAVTSAKKFNMERKVILANMKLYNIYTEMGAYENALQVGDEIRAYELKISNVEKSKAIAEVEAKYEAAKKEQQILQLESNNIKIKSQRNYLLGGGLILGLLAIFGFRLNKLRKDRNDKIAFSNALMGAQEEERKKIARDLHDGIGQSLLLIKKQMEKSNENTTTNQTMISETLEEVRSLSRDLHPFQLDKFGLTTTVEEMIQKITTNTDLFITKEIVNIDNAISKSSAIHVYRTIQEALSNVIKHAEASAAKVTFKFDNNDVLITIQDNGKGFDPELTIAKRKSLGLKIMQERIAAIGGSFKIAKGDTKGTFVSIRIPKSNSLN